MSERRKVCNRCRKRKPYSSFGPHRGHGDGLQTFCRPCKSGYEYAFRHGEHVPTFREKEPLIDLTLPPEGPSKVHRCGYRLAFVSDGNGHCREICDKCGTAEAFGR